MADKKVKEIQKNRVGLSLSILAVALFTLSPLASALKPYFKAFGEGIYTGGWFNNGSALCNVSDPNYQSSNSNPKVGGILGYAYYDSGTNRSRGASSVEGALALGAIEGNLSGKGFYTGSTGYKDLSFSNQASGAWGGLFTGSASRPHCIEDYYHTRQNPNLVRQTGNIADVSTFASGQYLYGAKGTVTSISSVGTIGPGENITVFVEGDAFIATNIVNSGSGTYSITNAPKFALVVLGNIYVNHGVSGLDGLYIAQPDIEKYPNGTASSADTGNFWTCHGNTGALPTPNWVSMHCRVKLRIDGAVIAKNAILLRSNGDVATSNTNDDPGTANISEVLNYQAKTVLGPPYFGESSNGSGATVDSMVSLPPVF